MTPATGAMWKFYTAPVDRTLAMPATGVTVPTLKIMDIKYVSASMKKSLVKIN